MAKSVDPKPTEDHSYLRTPIPKLSELASLSLLPGDLSVLLIYHIAFIVR